MISQLIKQHESYVIALRRHFHQYPEPSWEEFQTSKYIKNELDKMGISYKSVAKTGIVAIIEGNYSGKTVALRADMDALKVEEKNSIDYKSKNQNFMHACGHDGHMAMLLGAAKVLSESKDQINGTVKLLFQPAEERIEGARLMIEEGALDNVESIFGIHLWSNLDTGKVNCESGPRMASGDYIVIDIKGSGGHGSMPHQCVDPSIVAASFMLNVQGMTTRETDPLESLVFTFGEVSCGSRFNVIADKAHLEGTVRCFDPEIRKNLETQINRYGQNIAGAYGAEFCLDFNEGTPPTINDSKISKNVRDVAADFLDKEALVSMTKTTGSEDMAYYLEKIPGAIAFIGCKNSDKGIDFPHHHPQFNIDEDSLKIGTELYVRFAIDYLKKNNGNV
jgi:amidohydrolase